MTIRKVVGFALGIEFGYDQEVVEAVQIGETHEGVVSILLPAGRAHFNRQAECPPQFVVLFDGKLLARGISTEWIVAAP